MGIFSRLGDIINSNLNSVLDRADDPERSVRLMIQEMEDTLVEVRAAAARIMADQKSLARRVRELDAQAVEWATKAELAMSHDREDLARGALAEKARAVSLRDELVSEETALRMNLAANSDDVTKLEAKLREARAKRMAIEARAQAAHARLKVQQSLYDQRTGRAAAEFDTLERRIDRLEANAEALGLGHRTSLEGQLDGLKASDPVEAELEALKARLGKSATTDKKEDGEV